MCNYFEYVPEVMVYNDIFFILALAITLFGEPFECIIIPAFFSLEKRVY